MPEIPYNGSIVRTEFKGECIRVGLKERLAEMALDFIFIDGAFRKARNKKFKNAAFSKPFHHMTAAIPKVKVSYHGNPLCIRSPDTEKNARNAIDRHRLCPHTLIDVIIDSGLITPNFFDRKLIGEGIRIFCYGSGVIVISNVKTILRQCLLPFLFFRNQHGKKSSLICKFHVVRFPVHEFHRYGLRRRQKALDQQSLL